MKKRRGGRLAREAVDELTRNSKAGIYDKRK